MDKPLQQKFDKAGTLRDQGRCGAAIQLYQVVIDGLGGSDAATEPECRKMIAVCQSMRGNHDLAISDLTALIMAGGTNHELAGFHRDLANAYRRKGWRASAITHYLKALEFASDDAIGRSITQATLALMELEIGNRSRADDFMDQAVRGLMRHRSDGGDVPPFAEGTVLLRKAVYHLAIGSGTETVLDILTNAEAHFNPERFRWRLAEVNSYRAMAHHNAGAQHDASAAWHTVLDFIVQTQMDREVATQLLQELDPDETLQNTYGGITSN